LGGTATNVAVAAARLGRRSAVLTKVGPDGFGDFVRTALTDFGVSARYVSTAPQLQTPVVFCALNPPSDPPLLFYRSPIAPDLTEAAVTAGRADPDEAADRLLARGVRLALIKCGAEGVLAATESGRWPVPACAVEVVCGLGAGDGFGGALVHGLLSGWEPVRIAEYANAAGALVASRLACADAMPTAAEIEELL